MLNVWMCGFVDVRMCGLDVRIGCADWFSVREKYMGVGLKRKKRKPG